MNALEQITQYYDGAKAERSQVAKINHIQEGLVVLHHLKASRAAMDAYCLHPMFQADADFSTNIAKGVQMSSRAAMLTMEYRWRANSWLSDRVSKFGVSGWPDVGPLPEIRQMLIADKVQNFKDFREYHKGEHERSFELGIYFQIWLAALGIDWMQQQIWCTYIDNAYLHMTPQSRHNHVMGLLAMST